MTSQKVGRMLMKPRNVALLTGSILAIKLAPDVFPQHITRPFFQGYRDGRIRIIKKSQLEEFEEVCRDLGVNPDKYHLFVTGRWNIRARGVSWLPNGAHIGVPINFVDDLKQSSLHFGCQLKENMQSKEGKALQESFKLSKCARQFALAVEVARIDSLVSIAKACFLPMFFLMGYATSFALLPTLNFLPKSVSVLGIGSVYLIAYRFSLGRINESIDLTLDKKVANLSPSYANGGLEYYQKKIQRNIALRVLLENGKKRFSYYGNRNPGMFYSAHAPLTERRDAIKKIVDENNKQLN